LSGTLAGVKIFVTLFCHFASILAHSQLCANVNDNVYLNFAVQLHGFNSENYKFVQVT